MATRAIIIGELAVKVRSADLASAEFDTAIASDFEVEVEFTYTPGHPGNLSGHWDMAEEPIPDDLTIHAIKASVNVRFEGDHVSTIVRRGSDLKPMFTSREITAIEDQLIEMMEAGE